MAGGASDEDEGLIAGINVTPLVDVTLVLLIIFMVTARIIVSQGMPMDLPKSASGEALQTVFAVELTADVSFLVCKIDCVPGEAKLGKSIVVVDGGASERLAAPEVRARFTEAAARTPARTCRTNFMRLLLVDPCIQEFVFMLAADIPVRLEAGDFHPGTQAFRAPAVLGVE